MNRERPLLIYDGDCGFCKRWVERLRRITGERVEYRASQEVAADFPEVPAEEFDNAVQFVGVDGVRTSGAMAAFCALATASVVGRCLVWMHANVRPFAVLADGAYRFVARNRRFFSRFT